MAEIPPTAPWPSLLDWAFREREAVAMMKAAEQMADPHTTVCQHCGGTHSLPIPKGNLLRDRHGWTALVCPWCNHKELYCAKGAESHD